MDTKIRKYLDSDFEALQQIFHEVSEAPPWINLLPQGASRRYIQHEIEAARACVNLASLLSIYLKEIQGFAQAHDFKDFLWKDIPHLDEILKQYEHAYYLRNIILRPRFTGAGIGTNLLFELERQAMRHGHKRVVTPKPLQNKTNTQIF